jgi:uncharacterized membrane protein HdeD (DUF308 family)
MSNTHVQARLGMPLAGTVLLSVLAENWWLLLLRGAAAIVFGAIAFLWPGITLLSLTYLWGAYAFVDGIFGLWAAVVSQGGDTSSRWWLGISGIISILASAVAFFWPGMTALVLLMFIASWAIVIGGLQIYGAIQVRKVVQNEWWLILSGLLSIAFGVIMVAQPGAGAVAVVWIIAWYAMLFGCMYVGLAFRLKKYKNT